MTVLSPKSKNAKYLSKISIEKEGVFWKSSIDQDAVIAPLYEYRNPMLSTVIEIGARCVAVVDIVASPSVQTFYSFPARSSNETDQIREIESVKRKETVLSAAFVHAVHRLIALRESGIDAGAQARLLMTLRRSMSGTSIYPSITSDGFGGAIAEWRAGRRFIAIEFTPDGDYSWIATDASGSLERNEVGSGQPDASELGAALHTFSEQVGSANPNWRQIFA